jgi:RNA polymerase sigma-70 factor (ECF subfamily)
MVLVTGDVHRAADATDEAFVRALERWNRVSRCASPLAWTMRVAINVGRRQARRRNIEALALRRQVPRGDVPAAAGEAWAAVADLPPRQREIVVLRYVADLPETEIATALGVGRSTVSDCLTDARRALARMINEPELPHV